MTVSLWKSGESGSHSVHSSGWTQQSQPGLEILEDPGEQMVFSLCWNPGEVGFNRLEELAYRSESKQGWEEGTKFLLPCPVMWATTKRCGPDLGWMFLFQMIWLQKETCHPSTQQLGFQLVPGVVRLTIKISHCRAHACTLRRQINYSALIFDQTFSPTQCWGLLMHPVNVCWPNE